MVYVIKLVFFSLILDRLGLEWFYLQSFMFVIL